MSVRALWVLSMCKEDYGNVLFYRHFPTVEKMCKVLEEGSYVPLPSVSSFASNILVTLGLTDSKQFVEWRDKCSGLMQLPLVELHINTQTLWPVISITQNNLLVCCLPFEEGIRNLKKEELLKMPFISMGFSVLLGILSIIGAAKMDQPAWKPSESRGKQVINIKILEFIRCILTGESTHFQTFGQVYVKADLEGGNNDVSLSLGTVDPQQPLSLHSLIIHPCVTLSGASSMSVQKRLRFSPPLHELILFHYISSFPKDPPLQGVFKMAGEDSMELLLQLKLNEKVKNSFDFCDLVIVFFNKGPVKRMELNANHGSLKLSEDKYSLKWTIGSKFPKDLEIKLTAKIEFQDGPFMPNSDPFCIEKNCYVQVNLKQSNATLSGFNIDPKSITVSEGSKPKILMERSVQSTEYRIWNSYGELPFPLHADKIFQKICAQ
ncbi:AP-5 complex subunit mu-1 isoform X2 [Parasteatoda tepidariorum]|uniref:AP-5 complex subunit mu-1 isoform X2 n=1 Tax=Parasteatoda tepidariorum TaxID=114398 RepID=UPI00077F9DDE|nr:AP-5 complex subunit mu-1 isoform X2 [Parasteatoda tepidariorum]